MRHTRKKRSILVLLIVVLLTPLFVKSQPTSSTEVPNFKLRFQAANRLFFEKQYYFALREFLVLHEMDTTNANINYKIGFCYLKTTNKEKALPYLEAINGKIRRNYDAVSHVETYAPQDTYFHYGRALHLDHQFDKAIDAYTMFIAEVKKKHRLRKEAIRQIQMVRNAKEQVAHPQEVFIRNAGPIINSEFEDFSPVLSLDNNVLFFTSKRTRGDSSNFDVYSLADGKHYDDIYVSYKDRDGNFELPKLMNFSSLYGNEASISASASGQRLFVYKDVNGDGNIYFSDADDTTFTPLIKFPGTVNSLAWETHLTMSADGQTLYFVSNRKGGFGGRDIYRCKRLPNGKWSLPSNLGSKINTPYDEDAPFIAADGVTLYFSSNSHSSMGGFDVFKAQNFGDTLWSKPKNVGYPINTVNDDVFYVVGPDGKTSYYSSSKKGGYGEKDIYVIESGESSIQAVAVLKGYILTYDGSSIPAGIDIYGSNLTSGEDAQSYKPRSRDGGYVLAVNPCDEYLVEYFLDDVKFHEFQFTVPCEGGYQEIYKPLMLSPVKVGEKPRVVHPDSIPPVDSIVAPSPEKIVPPVEEQKDSVQKEQKDTTVVAPEIPNVPETIVPPVEEQKDSVQKEQKDTTVVAPETPNVPETITPPVKEEIKDTVSSVKSPLKEELPKAIEEKAKKETPIEKVPEVKEDALLKEIPEQKEKEKVSKEKVKKEKEEKIIVPKERNDKTSNDKDLKGDQTEESGTHAFFSQSFGYSKNSIKEDAEFHKFVIQCQKIYEEKGEIHLEIESSASKVPTNNRNLSNKDIAKRRSNQAKYRITQRLIKHGVKAKKIFFVSEKNLVQGPEYNNDSFRSKDEYEKFQYIKIKAY